MHPLRHRTLQALILAGLGFVVSPVGAQSGETLLPPSLWEVETGVSVSAHSPHAGGRGAFYLAPTFYLVPLRDTAAPRSLQPFLERASAISTSLSGGASVESSSGASARAQARFAGSASVNAYVTPWLALTGGFSYEADHWSSAGAGVGFRVGGGRVDVAYRFTAYGDANPRWGSIALQTYVVTAHALAVTLSTHLDADGFGGALKLAYFPSKNLGLLLAGGGQTTDSSSSDTRTTYYAVVTGFSYWLTPALRVAGSYEPGLTDSSALQALVSREVSHVLTISALARLP